MGKKKPRVNPVAKHAHKFNKPMVHRDKPSTNERRNIKTMDEETIYEVTVETTASTV